MGAMFKVDELADTWVYITGSGCAVKANLLWPLNYVINSAKRKLYGVASNLISVGSTNLLFICRELYISGEYPAGDVANRSF